MNDKVFRMFLIVLLVFSISTIALSSDFALESLMEQVQTRNDCYISQMRELVLLQTGMQTNDSFIRAAQNSIDFDAIDFDALMSDFGFQRREAPATNNQMLARLRQFDVILQNSKATILTATERSDDGPFVIVGIHAPCGFSDIFRVFFISEEYLELVDLLLEFTGIPEDMLEIGVSGLIQFGGHLERYSFNETTSEWIRVNY